MEYTTGSNLLNASNLNNYVRLKVYFQEYKGACTGGDQVLDKTIVKIPGIRYWVLDQHDKPGAILVLLANLNVFGFYDKNAKDLGLLRK